MMLIHRAGAIPWSSYPIKLSTMQTTIQSLHRVSLYFDRRLFSYLAVSSKSSTLPLRILTRLGLPKLMHNYAPVQSYRCMRSWWRLCDSVRGVCLLIKSLYPKCMKLFILHNRKCHDYTPHLALREDMYA
jgi:hypothetical protein